MIRRRRSVAILAPTLSGLLLLASASVALAAPPANDEQAGATSIVLYDGASFDLTEATTGAGDPAACTSGETEERSVWYSYTATEAGSTRIGAYANDPIAFHVLAPDGTTELGCADSGAVLTAPAVVIDAVIGETYLIEVAARGALGTLGAVFVERPLTVTTAIPTTGTINGAGAAVFEVAFTCSTNGYLEVEIDLVQGSGSNATNGSSLETYNCFAPGVDLTIVVEANDFSDPNARFRNGSVDVFFQWDAFSISEHVGDTDTGEAVLSGGATIAPPQTDRVGIGPGSSAPGERGSVAWALAVLSGLAAASLVVRRLGRSPGASV